MKHVMRAKKVLACNNCSGSIWKEDYYFIKYCLGGRYMGEKVDYQVHIHCATQEDICCNIGAMELREFIKGELL